MKILRANNKEWLPIYILAVAVFVMNTSEFLPIGLLTDISTSFNMPVSQTGQMVTTMLGWCL
ncbi:hypothetical protein GKC56_06005 [Neisseriaceae bacterium PsAf]|nr:hypothetical protein [Neisseriaceae bacterium PsAf]